MWSKLTSPLKYYCDQDESKLKESVPGVLGEFLGTKEVSFQVISNFPTFIHKYVFLVYTQVYIHMNIHSFYVSDKVPRSSIF